jgi:large subunit ribosomal protein L13
MIIDASNLIVGRLATVAAKKAMLGEGVVVVNCEAAIISGQKQLVLNKTKEDFDRGTWAKGPFIPKQADRYVKRVIRGMLPHKQPKGRAALEKVKCFVGIPDNYKDQKIETIAGANASKLPNSRWVTIQEICKNLGGKQ